MKAEAKRPRPLSISMTPELQNRVKAEQVFRKIPSFSLMVCILVEEWLDQIEKDQDG